MMGWQDHEQHLSMHTPFQSGTVQAVRLDSAQPAPQSSIARTAAELAGAQYFSVDRASVH